jgi:ribonuclease BN (tRNA processing enzyme)
MKKIKIYKLKKEEKISLTNDGRLSLFWIGAGSAFSKKLYQTNVLVIKGDSHLLIDCSSRCPLALLEYGTSITNIKNYLITHSHSDHIGGLEEVALSGRYISKIKPKMILTKEYEEALWSFSLKGGCAFNEKINDKYLEFSDFFESVRPAKIMDSPRPVFNIDFENINLKLFQTSHIPDTSKSWKDSYISYGVIIDDSVLFTSDTKYDKELIFDLLDKFNGIEFIFHDCQFYPGGVHASYQELLNFPKEIRAKMYLTHYGDNFNDFNVKEDGFSGLTKQGHYYIFNE